MDISEAHETFIRTNTEMLRKEIAVGMEQIRRGEVVDGKTATRNAREKLRHRDRGGK